MFAIEFQAQIKNGVIEIPTEYLDELGDVVRVIILAPERPQRSGMIQQLLEHPIQDPTFVPLKRDELYQARR
jgi:hypothetical protein